jgi:hypothetical protein
VSYFLSAQSSDPVAHTSRECVHARRSGRVLERAGAPPPGIPWCRQCRVPSQPVAQEQPFFDATAPILIASLPRVVRAGALAVLLILAMVSVAAAQPASLAVSPPVTDATGATFTVTWPGGGMYNWVAGYGDGTVSRQGVSSSPAAVNLPYHPSGAAMVGYVCVSTACAGLPVPAKPVAPPPPPPATTTHQLGYTEPATNADGTPLTDLAQVCAYWRIDAGAETRTCYPAATLTGGTDRTQALTVAATSGTIAVAYAAVDLVGNEGVRTATVSKTIGGTKPLPAGAGSLTITR